MKFCIQFFFGCATVVSMTCAILADETSAAPSVYEQQLQVVEELREHSDLKALHSLAATISSSNTLSTDQKQDLWSHLLNVCASTDFGAETGEAQRFADETATRILDQEVVSNPWTKLRLVFSLREQKPDWVHLAQWQKDRSTKARILATFWADLNQQLKGFNDKPDYVSRVPMPPSTGLMDGTPAEYIQDLELRKQYQAQVEENNRKAQIFLEKHDAFMVRNTFMRIVPATLPHLYSMPPFDKQELMTLLKPIVGDDTIKNAIVSEVDLAMRLRVEGVSKDPFPPPPATTNNTP